jgi:hypothetical protein
MPYRKNARIPAEIYLQQITARRDFFFPGMRLTDAGPLMVTGACVLLSTLKGRPLTRADIGRKLGVPESTTLRHLRALIKHGWVHKQGRLTCSRMNVAIHPSLSNTSSPRVRCLKRPLNN